MVRLLLMTAKSQMLISRQQRDSWNLQKGLSRTEAKRRYITTLIDTMHRYASNTPDARELVTELEFVWDQIKANSPTSSSTHSYPHNQNGTSPESTSEQPIYPVMSERGSRNPRTQRGGGGRLRVLSPVSQAQAEDREDRLDMDEREEFVDAQDSQIAADEDMSDVASLAGSLPSQRQMGPVQRNISAAGAMLAPFAKYMTTPRKDGKESNQSVSKWQKRIETSLIKMNAELAALREQLEMTQDATANSSILRPFISRHKRGGWLGWLFNSFWSLSSLVVKHLIVDTLLLVIIMLFLQYRGTSPEKLESMISNWIQKIRQIIMIDQLGKLRGRNGRLRLPIIVPRFLAVGNSRAPT